MRGAHRLPKTRALVAGLSVLCATSAGRRAGAGAPLGAQGTPIQTSDYTLDLFQGPVLASSRVTGLGGAYAGLAEGAEGIPFNPAAASQRFPYSTEHLDYDLTAGVTFPASVSGTDFENSGKRFGFGNFGAVGVSSMLAQVVDRSGERATVGMRAGAETEVVPNRLQLRVGAYLEPTRFRESTPRLHGTTGFEVRVLEWSAFGLFPEDTAFRISGAVDGSRDYFGWSLGVGTWF